MIKVTEPRLPFDESELKPKLKIEYGINYDYIEFLKIHGAEIKR